MKKSQILLEKISKLKDLRHAIHAVKAEADLAKDEVQAAPQAAQAAAPAPEQAKPQQSPNGSLVHGGIEIGHGGIITHVLAHPHSDLKYKINVDMSKDSPLITVGHFQKDGLKGMSPDVYPTIDSAVKSVINHFHKKAWK